MNEVKEKDNKETIKEETKVSESDTEESTAQEQKEDNNTVEKAVEAPPLGAILDKRTEEIRNVVFGAMAQYGIPASLMDYMLTSVLSEVRDLKSKEYSDCLVNKGNKSGKRKKYTDQIAKRKRARCQRCDC